MNRKNKMKPGGLDPPGDAREERILGEMYAAAKEERWDASPGFEARLAARLRDETTAPSFDPTRLIWKVVPAAAVVTAVAVAGFLLAGSFENLSDYIVSSSLDPVSVEDMITFGSF